MNKRSLSSALLNLVGFLLALLTIGTVVFAIFAEPALLKTPDAALLRAEALMEAVCSGKYAAASALLYGQPDLGSIPKNRTPAADQLWEAYRDSLDYTVSGEIRATAGGAALDVAVRSLDVPKVLEELEGLPQSLLNLKIESTENSPELYGEDGQLLPEISEELLSDAMLLALGREPMTERTVTLSLICQDGIWWILPEDALLNIMSGAFPG